MHYQLSSTQKSTLFRLLCVLSRKFNDPKATLGSFCKHILNVPAYNDDRVISLGSFILLRSDLELTKDDYANAIISVYSLFFQILYAEEEADEEALEFFIHHDCGEKIKHIVLDLINDHKLIIEAVIVPNPDIPGESIYMYSVGKYTVATDISVDLNVYEDYMEVASAILKLFDGEGGIDFIAFMINMIKL